MNKEEEGNRRKLYKKAAVTFCMAAVLVFLTGIGGCKRDSGVQLETAIALEETEEKSGKETSPEETEMEPENTIYVHVCGAVVSPGVYKLLEGSRVYEAVEAAGGMRDDAARDYLNMSGMLSDGCKVTVPFLTELEEGEQYGLQEPVGENGAQLVDINRADKEQLMSLPGRGEAKAEAVIAYREEHGDFKQPEDIMLVTGIKEAAYEKLKDKITVR